MKSSLTNCLIVLTYVKFKSGVSYNIPNHQHFRNLVYMKAIYEYYVCAFSSVASYHSRGGSLPRSEGGSKREPDLNEAVGFLKSKDSSLVVYGASYLQHLAYGDDTMKTRIR